MKRILIEVVVFFFVLLAFAVASPAHTKQPLFGVVGKHGKTNYPSDVQRNMDARRIPLTRRGIPGLHLPKPWSRKA